MSISRNGPEKHAVVEVESAAQAMLGCSKMQSGFFSGRNNQVLRFIDGKTIFPIVCHLIEPMPCRNMRGNVDNAYAGYFVDMVTYTGHICTS